MEKNQATYWAESAYCEACAVTIRKHHLARHRRQPGHLRRAKAFGELLPSDERFTVFLSLLSEQSFRGDEAILYAKFRARHFAKYAA